MILRFRTRVLLPVLVVVGVASSMAAFLGAQKMSEELESEYLLKGSTLARILATSAQENLQNRDASTIQGFLDEFKKVKGVGYIFLVDENDNVLAHTFSPGIPETLINDTKMNFGKSNEVSKFTLEYKGDPHIDVRAPIMSGYMGAVHVGVNMQLIYDIKKTAFYKIFTVLLALTSLALILIGSIISLPIKRVLMLADKVQAFARGEDVVIDLHLYRVKEFRQVAIAVRNMMEDVNKHSTGLEAAVVERTKKLVALNQQLVESSKMSALGEMAGGIAHEINNPLTIILGKAVQIYRTLQLDSVSSSEVRPHIEKIEQMANRIAKIVKGLRSFSRNGENDPMIPFKVSTIAEETLDLCVEKIKTLGVKVEVDIDPETLIECRSTEISQVLLNLISNSVDAIRNCENKWIKVALTNTDKHTLIRITDSGGGIPPEIAAKLMQPFFTTKDVGKGTGLGLSISKGILESHGGRIWLDQTSVNTCFVLELPLYVRPDEWALGA